MFASLRRGRPNLYRLSVDAPGSEQSLLESPTAKLPVGWSHDHRLLLFTALSERGDWDLWVLPLEPRSAPRPIVATPAEEREARFSPDGRWVAYTSNESGRFEIYVQSFPTATARWQISRDGGVQPQWRGDGQEIFYLARDGTLMAVTVRPAAPRFEVGAPQALFRPRLASFERLTAVSQYAAASDGQTFVINSLTPEALSRAVTVVLNWPALLQH